MLKSLELFGFKSFADRTSFTFSKGITCVVGPNGSGKSNVVDALKWILGDQSPKSLRGKEMTDVIFNGSGSRKPSGFAEAILVFDNASGILPVESEEVEVGRRVWRNGDSEYLLNRAPVRLKEIRDLFLGTGLGASAYSIIEQGRVDQILQTNATGRREVFEEAARITRYKARRADAQRKLERVAQNLIRLTDIVDEVEAQLNATRSQASKAAKYRELERELRSLRLGLAADDHRHLSGRLQEVQTLVDELAEQIEGLRASQHTLETEQATLDEKYTHVEERLRRVERDRTANREGIAREEATVRHQRARLLELTSELVRLREQKIDLDGRAHAAASELQQTNDKLAQFERECERIKAEVDAREHQILEVREKIELLTRDAEHGRARLSELARETSVAAKVVSGSESRLLALKASKQTALERLRELDELISQCGEELESRRTRRDEARSELNTAERNLQQILSTRSEYSKQQDLLLKKLADKREERSACLARKTVLEDLEQRQEGVRIGVKEILERARSSTHVPWKHIRGTVADLLDVDLEYAAIVEIALDDRAQLLVLDERVHLVEYLKRGTFDASERVGFMAISEIRDRSPATAGHQPPNATPGADDRIQGPLSGDLQSQSIGDLAGRQGVLGRADQFVRSDAKAPGLAAHLLADTWIVTDLSVALYLADETGNGYRFITLQGERLEADGRLYVGSWKSEYTLVSRKSELRKLKADLHDVDSEIQHVTGELAGLDQSLTQVDEELTTARSTLEQRKTDVASRSADLAEQEHNWKRLQEDLATVQHGIAQQEADALQLSEKLQDGQMELARCEEAASAAQDEIDRVEREIAKLGHRFKVLLQKQSDEKLQLAKQEERLLGLRSGYARLERDYEQTRLQSEEAGKRKERAISKCRQITLQILNAEAAIADLFVSKQDSESVETEILSQRERLRKQRTQLANNVLEARRERRELDEKRHVQEIAARDLRHAIETLHDRLREEYHIEITDVVATGASALEQCGQRTLNGAGDTADGTVSGSGRATEPVRFDEARAEIDAQVKRLQRKLKMIGYVNTTSLEELDELERRYGRLSAQLQDLIEAKAALEEIVRKVNLESRRLFLESFEAIRGHFREILRRLFGGGAGDIVLEDPNDILECGIDVVSRPPGKELRSISLLSGGEKTLTAVALLLAIFQSRPSPFCILDEVDAALDEANIDRYLEVLKGFQSSTQFIVITHSKRTMAAADVLYGITMEQSGVSKRISVRFQDVSESGEIVQSTRTSDTQTLRQVDDAA